MNDQRSLNDQLNDLERLAVKHGLYDAHDWMLNVRRQSVKRRKIDMNTKQQYDYSGQVTRLTQAREHMEKALQFVEEARIYDEQNGTASDEYDEVRVTVKETLAVLCGFRDAVVTLHANQILK